MSRYYFLIPLFFMVFTGDELYGIDRAIPSELYVIKSHPDSIKENQVLYNGRIWQNMYVTTQGDQFLFSKEFLPGALSISGKTFTAINLKYDIFKDEILTPADTGGILQLNKELVDSFSLSFQNKIYHFLKIKEDSLNDTGNYFNVLYKGKTTLYISYSKKIDKLSVEGKYDKFYQIVRIYFKKDNKAYLLNSKGDLIKVLAEHKAMIKKFIKDNRLNITDKEPESFIPVIRYYDSLGQ